MAYEREITKILDEYGVTDEAQKEAGVRDFAEHYLKLEQKYNDEVIKLTDRVEELEKEIDEHECADE